MHTTFSTWSERLGQFFQIFTKPGAEIFFGLMTGWVMYSTQNTLRQSTTTAPSLHPNRLPAIAGRAGYSFAPCLRRSIAIELSLATEHPPAVQASRSISPTQTASRQSRGGGLLFLCPVLAQQFSDFHIALVF